MPFFEVITCKLSPEFKRQPGSPLPIPHFLSQKFCELHCLRVGICFQRQPQLLPVNLLLCTWQSMHDLAMPIRLSLSSL